MREGLVVCVTCISGFLVSRPPTPVTPLVVRAAFSAPLSWLSGRWQTPVSPGCCHHLRTPAHLEHSCFPSNSSFLSSPGSNTPCFLPLSDSHRTTTWGPQSPVLLYLHIYMQDALLHSVSCIFMLDVGFPFSSFATWFDPTDPITVIHIWSTHTRDPKNALTRAAAQ